MYLSDLLSALNKNESIELSKPEIAAFFKKQEHITISQASPCSINWVSEVLKPNKKQPTAWAAQIQGLM